MPKPRIQLSGISVGLMLLTASACARAHAQGIPINYEADLDMNASLHHAGFDNKWTTKPAGINGDPHWWFDPLDLGEFGYEFQYSLTGSAFLHAALYAGGGTARVHYPVSVQIVWPKSAHAGDDLTITTKLMPTDGDYLAIGQTPTYKAVLAAGVKVDVSLNFWLEVLGHYVRDGTNNPLLEWHPPEFEKSFFDISKGDGNFTISDGVLYGHISAPDFTGVQSVPNSLEIHKSQDIGGVTGDITNLISQSLLGVNLSDSYDILGYTLGYNLIDLQGDLNLQANVDLKAETAPPQIRFSFSDGSPDQTVEVGKPINFTLKGDNVTVTPTLMVNGDMVDSHSMTMAVKMTFDPFYIYGQGSFLGYDLGFGIPPGDSFKTSLFDVPFLTLPIVSGKDNFAGSAMQAPYTIVLDTSPMQISPDPPDFGTTTGGSVSDDQFRPITGDITGGFNVKTMSAFVMCPNPLKSEAKMLPLLSRNIPVNAYTDAQGVGHFQVDGNANANFALAAHAHDGDIWYVQLVLPGQNGKPRQVSNTIPMKFDHQVIPPPSKDGIGKDVAVNTMGPIQLKPIFYTTPMPAFTKPGNPLETLVAQGTLVIDLNTQISQSFENVSRNPGSMFSRNATYLFDGQPIPSNLTFNTVKTTVGGVTQYKTTYQNVGQIPASLVTRTGNHVIEFRNGGLGATKTLVKQVTVIEQQPAVQHVGLAMEYGDVGTRNTPLALYGTGFTANSKILVDGKAVPTKFISPTQLQVDASSAVQIDETQNLQVSNAGGFAGGLSAAAPRSLLRSRARGAKGVLEVRNTVFADTLVEHKKETPQAAHPALRSLKGTQLTGVLGYQARKNPLPPITTNAPGLAALLTLGNTGDADLRDVRLSAVTLTVAGTPFNLPVPGDTHYDRLRARSRNIFVLHAPASAKGWKEGDSVEVIATGTADGKPFRIAQQTRIQTPTQTPPPSPSQIRFDP